jgi:large subunit ribosomal protein L17
MLRNLVTSLFEHERIETTVAKAKEARRVAERMITYAKRNNLHSRRLVARTVQNEDVAKKLFDTITPWYATRQGGYTRILKTRRRLGDAGEMAILELVKSGEQKEADRKVRAAKAEAKARAAEEKGKRASDRAKDKEKAEQKDTEAAEATTARKKEAKAKQEPEAKKAAKAEEKPKAAKPAAAKKAEAKKPEAKKPAEKATEKPGPKDTKKKGGGLLGRIRKKKDES